MPAMSAHFHLRPVDFDDMTAEEALGYLASLAAVYAKAGAEGPHDRIQRLMERLASSIPSKMLRYGPAKRHDTRST